MVVSGLSIPHGLYILATRSAESHTNLILLTRQIHDGNMRFTMRNAQCMATFCSMVVKTKRIKYVKTIAMFCVIRRKALSLQGGIK